jgi:hypothetical protein
MARDLFLFDHLSKNMAWPEHGCFLVPGVNDTWNEFQKSSIKKDVSTKDWKAAREKLHSQFSEYLAKGGIALTAAAESCRQEDGKYLFCIPFVT